MFEVKYDIMDVFAGLIGAALIVALVFFIIF